MKKGEAITLHRFAKLLSYSRSTDREFKAILRILTSKDMVRLQQSGFYADSSHHPKIIVILKPFELEHFKQNVLARTNFQVEDFMVHRTSKQRKCEKCSRLIENGQRYGVKLKFARAYRGRPRRVYEGTTLCLPCLIEKIGLEEWYFWVKYG